MLYRSIRANENPNYASDCNLIPSNAKYIKLVMGSAVDFYKPVTGKSFCEMLQSHKLHQWSSDGIRWKVPKYYHRNGGGSATDYPTDGRKWLSVWGGNGNHGGCCHYSYSDSPAWDRAFTIFYGLGM